MRFVNFQLGKQTQFGIRENGFVYSLSPSSYRSDIEFLATGAAGLEKARALLAGTHTDKIPVESVQLLSPVLHPGKILCVGLNYRDHAIESKMQIPRSPTIFLKLPNSVTGPESDIVLPRISAQPDYEVELAAVIGRRGKNIRPEDWEQYIAGYTILNDVSARDIQLATSQWTLAKSFDTFAPIGPSIVTADEVGDPHTLDIELSINGEVLQCSNTKHLIFRLPDLIAYISAIVPLEPGDIISTGTPAGVGFGRQPHRWLKPGDIIVASIQGIGELQNRVVASPPASSRN